jgi:diguanylate cyclase (GGDEF)-like protein
VDTWTAHAVPDCADDFLAATSAVALRRMVPGGLIPGGLIPGELICVVSAGPFPRPKALHHSRWVTLAFIGAQLAEFIELGLQSFRHERESERLRHAIRAVGAGVWQLDVGKGIFSGDAVLAKLLSWPGTTIDADFDVVLDLIHPDDRAGFLYAIGRATHLGQNDRHIFRVKDSDRWLMAGFERDNRSADGPVCFVGMMRDYSDQRSAELETQMHQQQLETMVKDLRKSNRIDPLTGIANRIAFDERVRTEVLSARAKNEWLTLIMVDVDHFKRFNDNFGHVAGDDALKLVAAEIAKSVRANDIAARFGGEEFCVLSFSAPEIALKIAERIRHAVEIFSWPVRAITVSIGVCSMLGPAIDRSELFQHSDEALYRAKEQGRNRVVVA